MKWTAISSRLLLPAAVAVIAAAGGGWMLPGAGACPAHAPAPAVTPPTPAAPPVAPAQPSAIEAGMRAYIDPETGLLTSLPTASQTLAPPSVESEPVLQEEILPDGSVMIDLKGTLQDYLILQLDANGQKVVRCVEDPKAALQAPPQAPQREDR